ncbi:MAG: tetratricopeptide repeat protein, partial [Candidatus Competibacterales bacterium]|nr:tetratricopeptide repeat protein [Candidatus Competibacterales bacterium]
RLAQSSRFEDNAPLAPGSEAYRLARVRARVLTTTNTTQLGQWFQERLAAGDGPGESALRYGYALTLRRAGRYEEAAAQLESLLRREPDRLAFRIEQAELALARGEAERAWSLFERILTLYPDNYVATVHYSQALAAQGDPRRAMRLLDPYRQRRSRDPLLFQLYARAAQRAGERPAMYGALAEFHYLNGELEQAIEQAERGLAQGGSPYEKAQLQARLRDYRAARR